MTDIPAAGQFQPPADDEPAGDAHTRNPRRFAPLAVAALVGLLVGGGAGYLSAQPALSSAQAEIATLSSELSNTESELTRTSSELFSTEAQLTEATATVDKLTAGLDPVVLKINFPMPTGYPVLSDIGTVPERMQRALDTGTGQVVAVAPGVWAAFPPGATVESAVNALAFDGYCASKVAFEAQYLSGQSTSGSCW